MTASAIRGRVTRDHARRGWRRSQVIGLDARVLHERCWAASDVTVVRRGAAADGAPPPAAGRSTYLLLEPDELVLFDPPCPPRAAGRLLGPRVRFVRVTEGETSGYRERVDADERGALRAIEREYDLPPRTLAVVTMTRDRRLAEVWRRGADRVSAMREILRVAGVGGWRETSRPGVACDGSTERGRERYAEAVRTRWRRASAARGAEVATRAIRAPRRRPGTPRGKRAFDVVVGVALLACVAPLFPIIMLLIWLEDGRPLFFAHTRQTEGGRAFACYKFRTMCRNAERLQGELRTRNTCDGPQFHLDADPRLLRVGRVLRRLYLDELPQLVNVLRGEMSLIGPRPSPEDENVYCPAWRDARLSVKPGLTGQWQVSRTRAPDRDFQEWIRHDLDYVRRPGWGRDLAIMLRTAGEVLGRLRPQRNAKPGPADVR